MKAIWAFAAAVVLVMLLVIFQPHLFDRLPRATMVVDGKTVPSCPKIDNEMRFTCNGETRKCWCGVSRDFEKGLEFEPEPAK